MDEAERYDGQEVGGGVSWWYAYGISYDLSTSPDDHPYKVEIHRYELPHLTEEVRGNTWGLDMGYTAWFPTLEEAKAAAEAFVDEMHWQREAENLGAGRELMKQAHAEMLKVANELRRVSKIEPGQLTSRFRYYDLDKEWELDRDRMPGVRIEAGDDNEFILIDAINEERAYKDYWDAGWPNAHAAIKVGSFRGDVGGYLRGTDLATFQAELTALYNTLSGSALLRTREDWLSIEMIGDGKGHIIAKCAVTDNPGIGNTLQFKLELDQTFLPTILEALSELRALFPIVGSAE